VSAGGTVESAARALSLSARPNPSGGAVAFGISRDGREDCALEIVTATGRCVLRRAFRQGLAAGRVRVGRARRGWRPACERSVLRARARGWAAGDEEDLASPLIKTPTMDSDDERDRSGYVGSPPARNPQSHTLEIARHAARSRFSPHARMISHAARAMAVSFLPNFIADWKPWKLARAVRRAAPRRRRRRLKSSTDRNR
jgi:hypothetical protein